MSIKKLSNRKAVLLAVLITLAIAALIIAILQHESVDVMMEYIFLVAGISHPVVI